MCKVQIKLQLLFPAGQSYEAELVGQDPGLDLALLKINASEEPLSSVKLGDSSRLEVGQRVLAIGNPFGLNQTLTTGVVSSLGRTIRGQNGRLIEDIIQIDAAINPGNSGGPLLDTLGRLVGINTFIISRSGDSAGIGFAIPINHIRRAVPQLIKYGRVLRPKIGVVLTDTDYGPVVIYVKPGSPAEEAGLEAARQQRRLGYRKYVTFDSQQADFVVEVDGKRVATKEGLIDELGKKNAGEEVELTVRRGVGKKAVRRKVKVRPFLG